MTGEGTDRRTLLAAAAVLTPVAACSGPAPPPPAGFAPGRPMADPAATSGTVLGPAAAVPAGGGIVRRDLAVVVTRSADGELRALSAICPHDGCLVGEVVDGAIVCACHGSRFALDGSVARGPATTSLAVRPVRVEQGRIVLG
ncbi:ubiquinol-cytochrome c reductase iron-sulfur subunit [Actinomycetospora atypica]|uniref:Cytochrome bc1 complex Rieske iron-sulfur subunit n=1 Tax=Actinomycetospora atypica TaxID=1290095 RepID=A0ABV9YSY6_9PSEU